jgi:hypothetical protein
MLEVGRSVAAMWRVFPSAQGRRELGGARERDLSAALADPDRRLGVILEATVTALEADPSEPLHFATRSTIARPRSRAVAAQSRFAQSSTQRRR